MAWAESKRDCYDRYIRFADHPIERVDLTVPGGKQAALLHLPHQPAPGERFPCILYQPGMDGVKEDNPLMGDPLLQRGLAILSIDGPGQGETRERGITCTASNCEDGAKAAYAYLKTRPEIDGDRMAIYGSSMGSYWGTRMAAAEPGFKACAVVGVCMEPTQYTIFNTAAPTFKLNYMYMSRLRRRGGVRRVLQDADPRGGRGQDPMSLHGRRGRGRRALSHRVRVRGRGRGHLPQGALRLRGRTPLAPQPGGAHHRRGLGSRTASTASR